MPPAVPKANTGALGVPRDLNATIEEVPVGGSNMPMLNVAAILRSKLYALHQKGQSLKDMEDISFLLRRYEAQAISARENIRREWRQHYVNLLARMAAPDNVRKAMTVLDIRSVSPESD